MNRKKRTVRVATIWRRRDGRAEFLMQNGITWSRRMAEEGTFTAREAAEVVARAFDGEWSGSLRVCWIEVRR